MKYFLASVLFLISTIVSATPPWRDVPPYRAAVPSGWGTALAGHINLKRLDRNLPQLGLDDQLICASSLQAAYLAQMIGICIHQGFSGSDLKTRVDLCGGPLPSGEVLGCGHETYWAVVDAWMKSPAHYKIIMDPRAKRIGGAMLSKQWVVVVGF